MTAPTETPALNFVVLVTLGDGATEAVPPAGVVVLAALTMLSNVGVPVPLLLSVVTLVVEHCPANAQYWSLAQHIDPQNVSPRLLLQAIEGAATLAITEVCAEVKIVGVETETG